MALVSDSIDVAAYITKYCASHNYFINLTKLQKLMYCVYGAVLAVTGERICEEHPKAWPHGPVFPRVYKFTKKNQDNVINVLLRREEDVELLISDLVKNVIQKVIDIFSRYTAGQLVEWSHNSNGAWFICTNGGRVLQQEIPDDLISDYFKKVITVEDNNAEC